MKTIKIKHSLQSQGRLSAAHPGAEPGQQRGGAIVIAVTGLPDDATIRDAIAVCENVMMPAWVNVVDASQRGKNLYRAENLTDEQLAAAPKWYREKYCIPA